MRDAVAILVSLCAVACSEHSSNTGASETGGTLVISTTGDPGTLFPPLIRTTQGKQISEQIYDYLADVGPEMNTRDEKGFRPQLTDGWRWSADSLSLAFHLNPSARWHDGKAVTAHDVQFTFALNRNPALGGYFVSELSNIDSVTTSDSLTAVFWFHKRLPTQFLDGAAQLLILPAHQLDAIDVAKLRESAPPPIGTGRLRLLPIRRITGVAPSSIASSGASLPNSRLPRRSCSVMTPISSKDSPRKIFRSWRATLTFGR
jgi:ABC-type transport system substrate-binding protein